MMVWLSDLEITFTFLLHLLPSLIFSTYACTGFILTDLFNILSTFVSSVVLSLVL